MIQYETVFIFRPDLSEGQTNGIMDRLRDTVESMGGKPVSINEWGIRKLAYTINYRRDKFQRGNYLIFTYLGNGGIVDELDRITKLMDEVIRTMTIKLEGDVDPATIAEMTVIRETPTEPEAVAEKEPEPVMDEPPVEAPDQDAEAGAEEDATLNEEPGVIEESEPAGEDEEKEKEQERKE